jgi:superfamily II DNA/RNA helicase
MTTFKDFALPEALQHKLDALGFDTPTPVQERAIPAALEHRDILGSAQTGTGKTAGVFHSTFDKDYEPRGCLWHHRHTYT